MIDNSKLKYEDSEWNSLPIKEGINVKRVEELKIDIKNSMPRERENTNHSGYVTKSDLQSKFYQINLIENQNLDKEISGEKSKIIFQDDKSNKSLTSIDVSHMKSVLENKKLKNSDYKQDLKWDSK